MWFSVGDRVKFYDYDGEILEGTIDIIKSQTYIIKIDNEDEPYEFHHGAVIENLTSHKD